METRSLFFKVVKNRQRGLSDRLTFVVRIISRGSAECSGVKEQREQELGVNPGESHVSRLLRACIPVRKLAE